MASTNLVPTTELEAVNVLLETIGESPVNSLNDQLIIDAVLARQDLSETSKAVQTEKWNFNTEKNFPLAPDTNGTIFVPRNCVWVEVPFNKYPGLEVIQRGNRLYDRNNHTYKFDKTLYCEVVLLLNWDELPEAGRRYIFIRAARVFQQRMVGSDLLFKFTDYDERQAKATLRDYDSRIARHNMVRGRDNILATWNVGQTLLR